MKNMKSTMTSTANRLNSKSAFAIGALLSALAALTACVTVNVVLPESAVQRAADDYVRELYKAKERSKATTPAAEPSAKPTTSHFSLISEAFADEAGVFSLKSPKAHAILTKLAPQLHEIDSLKESGQIGEGNDGFLVVKDAGAGLSGPKKINAQKNATKVVDAANKLRKELYEEGQASATGQVKLETIQKSVGHSFEEFSPKGTWIQDAKGAWSKKTVEAKTTDSN